MNPEYAKAERDLYHAITLAASLCEDGEHDAAAVIVQAGVNCYEPDE